MTMDALEVASINPTFGFCFVDTIEDVTKLADILHNIPLTKPFFYLGMQGAAVMEVFIVALNCVFLVDLHSLGISAFSTSGTYGLTLKTILENRSITKATFDTRPIAQALFLKFKIKLDGIVDIQLLELATHRYASRQVKSLAVCLKSDLGIIHKTQSDLFNSRSPEAACSSLDKACAFLRPLPLSNKVYCVREVQYLPDLSHLYISKLNAAWRARVTLASRERAVIARHSAYDSAKHGHTDIPIGW